MPDLITNTDIAPNAGILGTQIADHTIDIRNLKQSNSAIILLSGTYDMVVSAGTYAHGATMGVVSIAHGLQLTPTPIISVTTPNFGVIGKNTTQPVPAFTYVDTGTNIFPGTVAFGGVDGTNLTLKVVNLYTSSTLGNDFTWHFTYYLLQQSAV